MGNLLMPESRWRGAKAVESAGSAVLCCSASIGPRRALPDRFPLATETVMMAVSLQSRDIMDE
jgi:hypothetical protein